MLLTGRNFRVSFITAFSALVAAIFGFSISAVAQTDAATAQSQPEKPAVRETEKQTVLQPAVADLKGIAIGMTADEVKDKLGKAKIADKDGFYYVFSDEEAMQITLDTDKKVRMIAAYYTGEDANAPKYEDVFGAGATAETSADGKIYKLVNYSDAGYWVAYNRIMVGDDAMVTVTMQKMN